MKEIRVTAHMVEVGAAFMELLFAVDIAIESGTMTKAECIAKLSGAADADLFQRYLDGEFPPAVGMYMAMERARVIEEAEPCSSVTH